MVLAGKRAFTLIEMIFAIVILAFVLIGGFQIVGKLYKRNYIAKETSKMEFVSQSVLDEIAGIIYYRIPLSVIGYNQQTGDFKYIGDITEDDKNYSILEWIGYENDAMVERNLSGFVDLYASIRPYLKTLDFNTSFINTVIGNKYGGNIINSSAVIFAGSFDRGEEAALVDYNSSFGWHGNSANLVYEILSYSQDGNYTSLELNLSNKSNIRIYEKFYLADGAFAIALKRDLIASKWSCRDYAFSDFEDNDLLLFYNYRPWKGETFCGDDNGNPEGNVTLLASDVNAFKVKKVNNHLEIKMELFKQRGDINISVSKQKVAF